MYSALMKTDIRIYGYLRASTDEQDASRAKNELMLFAEQMGFQVACWFEENESGAQLKRPELFRLLDIAISGDVIGSSAFLVGQNANILYSCKSRTNL